MPVPLEQWQARLERHFADLTAARKASDFPIFALEHGLNNSELDEIALLLRSRLTTELKLSPHWLVWIVYATELGYTYDGGEYWQTFDERTPHWRENIDRRRRLRTWFLKFQTTYHGVEPSGRWAEWFKNIAWPITHAILPKYLQFQFAKVLYDARYRLAGLGALDPGTVGRLLAAEAWNASSRFREFLEQEQLVGRIVLALVAHKTVDGPSPIYEPTLQRIVQDLERVRSAREWLGEARRVVADRFHGAGRIISGRSAGHGGAAVAAGREGSATDTPSIRSSLLLRRIGETAWSVVIEISGFGAVARLHPDLRIFLRGTRCRIAGASDTWLPAGWVLSGTQRRVLKSWPGPREPLVEFERPNKMLSHLLESECRLKQGPIWLFRIGPDGFAREIMGQIVRPGWQYGYIILSETALSSGHSLLAPCEIECEGISASLLRLPDNMSGEEIAELQEFGLQIARTIHIWPAGLVSRNWDGEGSSEWLTTETPCFGMVHDHPVDSYSISLDGSSVTVIEAGVAGCPAFVKLPALPRGRHVLTVTVTRDSTTQPSVPLPKIKGVVVLDVREPEPWVPGTTSHAGMSVFLEPHAPTLDDFWQEEVAVSILGPEGYQVTCLIVLYRANGEAILSDQIGPLDLPVTPTAWSRKFHDFIKDEARTWSYLEAVSARIVYRADELGEFVLQLERDVKPIRWVCRSAHRTIFLRLIDETGRDEVTSIRHFTFGHAAMPEVLVTASVLAGVEVKAPGGLFVAQHAEHLDSIVVSSPQVERGFQGLVTEPNIKELDDPSLEIMSIIQLLEAWMKARLVGPIADIRRDRVVRRLSQVLYARMCGKKWGEAETAFLGNPQSPKALEALVGSIDRFPGFAVILQRDWEKFEAGTPRFANWFAETVSRFEVCSERALAEFALRAVSQPHCLSSIYGGQLNTLLRQVKDKTVLLRGARMLAVLAVAKADSAPGIAFPRWTWRS